MEKRFTWHPIKSLMSWYPVRKAVRWIDSKIERRVILDDLEDHANFQRLEVLKALDTVVTIYEYELRKNPKLKKQHIIDVVDLRSLTSEIRKLRSTVRDFTRVKHVSPLFSMCSNYYLQNAAASILEVFAEKYPRTSDKYYVNYTYSKLHTELISDIVFGNLIGVRNPQYEYTRFYTKE